MCLFGLREMSISPSLIDEHMGIIGANIDLIWDHIEAWLSPTCEMLWRVMRCYSLWVGLTPAHLLTLCNQAESLLMWQFLRSVSCGKGKRASAFGQCCTAMWDCWMSEEANWKNNFLSMSLIKFRSFLGPWSKQYWEWLIYQAINLAPLQLQIHCESRR